MVISSHRQINGAWLPDFQAMQQVTQVLSPREAVQAGCGMESSDIKIASALIDWGQSGERRTVVSLCHSADLHRVIQGGLIHHQDHIITEITQVEHKAWIHGKLG